MSYLNEVGLSHLWSKIVTKLNNKVDKVSGKGLSTNDYTNEEKAKVTTAANLNIRNGASTGSVKTSSATSASGTYSFAEGRSTTASGSASHAEGQGTTAGGNSSHAEGNSSTASGSTSHAEGSNAVASGDSSHAEGSFTTASGRGSHAEGYFTTAKGNYSHTGGERTIVKGSRGTAIGKYNLDPDSDENTLVTQSNTPHSFYSSSTYTTTYTQPTISVEDGTVTCTNTSSLKPDQFQIGMYVINNIIDEPGYFKILSTPSSSGYYCHANVDSYLIKIRRSILSTYAFSVGNGTTEYRRSNAHTLDWSGNAWYQGDVYVGSTSGTNKDNGSKKLASEEYVETAVANLVDSSPDALNTLNELAAALGDDPNFATTVTGQIGKKVDKTTTVNGKALSSNITLSASDVGADASGTANTALASAKAYTDALNIKNGTANGSIIANHYERPEGEDYLEGENSFAEGMLTEATGIASHAEGYKTIANGLYSHAEGSNTIANGSLSHAEGHSTTASGLASHVEGYETIASGIYSHAEGVNTTASGTGSHAEGYNTKASGNYSHAEGTRTTASGNYSFSSGSGNESKGLNSATFGEDTIANRRDSFAIGKYNLDTDSIENVLDTSSNIAYSFSNGSYLASLTEPTFSIEEGAIIFADDAVVLQPEAFETGMYVKIPSNQYLCWKILSVPVLNSSGTYDATVNCYQMNVACNQIGTYAFSVGNGSGDSYRSNAHTLDWSGNAWFKGNVYTGGASQNDANAKQLATQEYVNGRVPKFTYSTIDLEAGVSELAEGEVYFVYE